MIRLSKHYAIRIIILNQMWGDHMGNNLVKQEVKVIGAEYSNEARCILLHVESDKGKYFTQLRVEDLLPQVTNLGDFSEADMKKATAPFCQDIVGKNIHVVFDPDLQTIESFSNPNA